MRGETRCCTSKLISNTALHRRLLLAAKNR